ncbi:2S albumin-like [Punica granatum]|uniref:Uncharacterized protein n=2 Tax=Punica granatum TaxID=22663 RepID=A0A2I0JHZ1_PUNGR|nr:2S albumin-like [Punica granatum]PKI55884.1 hypothetical protein CRG98_023765 [Punica granatum]
MARRLAVLAAVFVAMFMVASAYKTTVTTMVLEDNDDENQSRRGGRQQCREQIQRQQQLFHCQQVLTRGGRYIVLGMRGAEDSNPESLQQCCQQLRQVEEQCRCQGIEEIVQIQQQQGRLQGQRLREVIQTAENLPNMCRLSPQRCSVSVRGGSGGGYTELDS